MTENPVASSESNDRKEIYIIAVVGVVFLACVCCLISIAGYFLYKDIAPSLGSPQSTRTATVEPSSSAMGKESFTDSFNSNRSGWSEGSFEDEYGTIDYVVDGTYTWDVVAAQGVNQKSWAKSAPIVYDFTASSDVTHVSGAENASYGMIFRVVDDQNLYYFCISDVGYYYVGLLSEGTWTTLIDWKETDVINVNSSNTLKVVGKGDQFTFFINDHEVEAIHEGTLPSGTAGLAIELYDAGDVSTFEFDNFSLESP